MPKADASPCAKMKAKQALIEAAYVGDLAAWSQALAEGADPWEPWAGGRSAVQCAVSVGNVACLAALPPGLDFKVRGRSPEDAQLASAAAALGSAASLAWLLRAGADPDGRNSAGDTPLIQAASYGEAGCVALLIQAGADVDAKNAKGESAAARAAFDGREECLRLLIEAGADVQARGQLGDSPASLAALIKALALSAREARQLSEASAAGPPERGGSQRI